MNKLQEDIKDITISEERGITASELISRIVAQYYNITLMGIKFRASRVNRDEILKQAGAAYYTQGVATDKQLLESVGAYVTVKGQGMSPFEVLAPGLLTKLKLVVQLHRAGMFEIRELSEGDFELIEAYQCEEGN